MDLLPMSQALTTRTNKSKYTNENKNYTAEIAVFDADVHLIQLGGKCTGLCANVADK